MPHQRQELGKKGEDLAAAYLKERGFDIIDKNFHLGRYAEIDLIGRDRDEIVFIEVKTRSGLGQGYPEEAVTRFKQEKIKQAAESYLLAHPQLSNNHRFDVVAIYFEAKGKYQIKHFRNII
ncbi:MAG: YraN family protein [Patescibacteria group bacterium]